MNTGLLALDVPATYNESQITIVGEKPGKDEANWRRCPKCHEGTTELRCHVCELSTVASPEGFVGRAGASLAKMARAAGIESFNKTNVVKCIEGGFTSHEFERNFYETVRTESSGLNRQKVGGVRGVTRPTAQYQIWIDRLRAELDERRVNVVVAAGGEALFALTGRTGIENYRGSILESTLVEGQKVIPILHPAAMLHSQRWEYYYVTISDLKRAKRESQFTGVAQCNYDKIVWPRWDDVVNFIGLAMQPNTRWCLDLETRAGWVACIGLSYGTGPGDIHTLCIPIQTTTGPYWSAIEEAAVWRLVATLMRRNPNLVGQNLFGFDLDYMLDYGCEPSGVFMDTMSAFALLYPELPKSLDFIVSLYGTLPYYKMESKTWNAGMPDDQLFTYNTKDTFSTLEISWKIEADLKTAGLWDLHNHYVQPVHWMGLEIQKRRITVSIENRDAARQIVLDARAETQAQRVEMIKKYEPELNLKKKRTKFAIEYSKNKTAKTWTGKSLDVPGVVIEGAKKTDVTKGIKAAVLAASPMVDEEITAENFNVGSTKHMAALVFGAMKLPERHKRGTGALSTDEESLMDLIAYYPDKTADLKLLMREKHFNKALDYVDYKLDPDGFLAFQLNFPGTKSFRFSMSTSPHGFGFNAQTPPRWSRFQYIPLSGRVFIARDLSQVEARVVAALANCRRQLERFADPNWSIHKDLGKVIYGETPPKDTPRYVAAKGGVHGGNFREGPLKMARSTGAPLRDTKLAVEGYHRTYPEIRQWHDQVRQTVIHKGQMINPFGFRRVFYKACGHLALQGVLDESEWNEACNAIPQSVPPFLVNQAILRTMEALPWVWFHHQGHDSYLASVPIGRALEADAFLREALDVPMQFNGVELRVPSEAQIGYTWLEMMGFGEVEPTYEEWWHWAKAEAAAGRGRSVKSILQGINGIL